MRPSPTERVLPLSFRWLLCGMAAAAIGCGGEDPVSATNLLPEPTPRPPTVLTITSGEDTGPLAGATVVLGGNRLPVDSAGQITLPESVRDGDPIDILADGFFDRWTMVLPGSATVGLWPLRSPTGLDENSTARLVYTSTQDGAPLGEAPLMRPGGPVFLVPAPELQGDARAVAEIEYAAATVTAATGGQLSFTLTTSPSSGGIRFDVKFDPNDSHCLESRALAFCRSWTSNSWIQRGEIVVCRESSLYTLTMTHEVGHAFGLRHSENRRDMMGVPYTSQRSSTFTAREELAMRLMLQRRAGNRYPDNGRSAAVTGARLETIVCH